MSVVKNNTLTQKMYLNTLASLLACGTTMVVAFVTSPLLLSYLGQMSFGTWKFCQRLLGGVSVVDGRATQALKWTIANKQNSDDFEAMQRDVGCAVIVYFFFLPFLFVAGSAAAWFSPYLINNLPNEHFLIVRLTCALLVLNMLLTPLQNIPQAVLIGTNQAHKCMGIQPLADLVGGAMMIWFAYIGWGITGVAGGLFLAAIIRAVLIFSKARRSISWFGIKWPRKDEVRHFFRFSFWVFCWTFVNKLMLSSDILILGIVVSTEKVTSYALSQYAMLLSVRITTMVVGAVTPGLGGIVGDKDFKRAGKIRGEIMAGSWLIIVVLGSMTLLWNCSFIGLWVGSDIFVGIIENLMMVLLMVQLVFARNDAFIIDLTLNIKTKVLLGVLSTTTELVLAYFLTQWFSSNIVGLVVGLMTGRCILTVSYPLMVNKAFGLNGREQIVALLRPALATIVLFCVTMYFSMHFQTKSWFYLMLYVLVSFVLLIGIAFFLGLSRKQRGNILSRFMHIPLLRSLLPQ